MRLRTARRAVGRIGRWPGLAALAGALVLAAVLILEFSGGLQAAHALNWVKEHWLNAAAITAAATVAAAAPALLAGRRAGESPGADRLARERRAVLGRVRSNWIAGVLMSLYAEAPQIEVGRQTRPDLTGTGSHGAGSAPEPVPAARTALQMFDEAGGRLLIVGAPGSGKTVFLLELAEELIRRAEAGPVAPMPVVLNLASWHIRRAPLDSWICAELRAGYDVPRATAESWLAQDALALLLDGLDEVPERDRAACAEAINVYRRDHGLVPVAVCARTEQARNLPVRLSLQQAVELLPPSDDQIAGYLDALEKTGTQVADVRAALAADPEMRELLRSPLMLQVMTVAYRGQPLTHLAHPGNVHQRRQRLWDAYVTAMLGRREGRHRYTGQQAAAWLATLARAMQYQGLTEFRLDRMESFDGDGQGKPVLGQVLAGEEHPFWAEKLRWTWKGVQHSSPAYAIGFISVFCLAPILATTYGWSWKVALAMFTAPGLSMLFLSRLTPEWISGQTSPGEGIRRSGRNGVVTGMATWLVLAAVFGVPFGPAFGVRTGAVIGLLACLFFGGGAFLFHYADHAGLARRGVIPWRYQSFLDDMTDRLILRRNGGSYMFIHQLLRDHLAQHAASCGARPKRAVSRRRALADHERQAAG